ncbi:hypothetical protein L596_018251 [Steinernema carpocapsae]|uniref:Tyrosine-protein phosphatase domain-containing protein n=1 Tax=Steinernema carpocapsae TaxID=34508 RepID=A0A4U5N535_STECR|nr:hypothetical protein L596_018251 [Steinernema carpocapsae]
MPPKGSEPAEERSVRRKKERISGRKMPSTDKKGSKAALKPPATKNSGEPRPKKNQSLETPPKGPMSLYMAPGSDASSGNEQGPRLTKEQLRPIAMKWVKRTLEKGVEGLRMEFASQKKPVDPDLMKEFQVNWPLGKNRYKDVGCLDSTRVVLNPKSVDSDYIHANYVSTPHNDKRFICTQGPLDTTIQDFWRMIIQERTSIILMLCNIVEKGMKKCAEYWPQKPGERMNFDNISILCVNIINKFEPRMDSPSKVHIRLTGIRIFVDDALHLNVDHVQWVDWPDRGVPPCDLTAIGLLNHLRRTAFPIVVHCSAGIGRTGSIVMLEYMLERLMVGEEIENMEVLLNRLRAQRAYSIQTDHQYLYIHRVMLQYFVKKGVIPNLPEVMYGMKGFVAEYEKYCEF